MVTPRKPHGYIDNENVDQALQANTRMADQLLAVSEILAQDGRLSRVAVNMALLLSKQATALHEIQAVRERPDGRHRPDVYHEGTESQVTPVTIDRQQPNELLETLMTQARDQGRPLWACINWGPNSNGGPDTEVHLIIATELAGIVLRLQSRRAVDALITALQQNEDSCWPTGC